MLKGKAVNIETIGLEKYLEETKEYHNGEGYDRFIFYIRPELNIKNTVIGRLMNVNRRTVERWIEVHDKEQTNVK